MTESFDMLIRQLSSQEIEEGFKELPDYLKVRYYEKVKEIKVQLDNSYQYYDQIKKDYEACLAIIKELKNDN